MANINRVVLVGNLTKDPELRHTPSGTAVCKLRLAVNTRQKDQATGEWGDKPNYFDVTVWGNQGESCAQFLSKGRPVGVDGRLDWREWEAQDGTKRQAVEIIAETVQFLGTRGDGEGQRSTSRPATSPPTSPTSSSPAPRRRRRHSVLEGEAPMACHHSREQQTRPQAAVGRPGSDPAEELLLLQGEDRRGRLQELQPAPPVRLGEGQDPVAPDHRARAGDTRGRSRSR